MAREKCPQCGNACNSANLFGVDTRWPNSGGGIYCGACLEEFLGVPLKSVDFNIRCVEDDEFEPHLNGKCLLCKALGRYGDEDMIPHSELVEVITLDAEAGNVFAGAIVSLLQIHFPEQGSSCCRVTGTLECKSCPSGSRTLEGHGALWPCDSYKAIEMPLRASCG